MSQPLYQHPLSRHPTQLSQHKPPPLSENILGYFLVIATAQIVALAWASVASHTFSRFKNIESVGVWVYAIVVTLVGLGIVYLYVHSVEKSDELPEIPI